jgi:hypothetical protein
MPVYEKVLNSPYDKDHKNKFDNNVPEQHKTEYDNKSKETNYDRQIKSLLPSNQNKIVDLQVYQPPPPKGPNPYTGKKPFLPVEPIALTTPYVPPQYQNYVNNMMKDFYTPFIYKDYNIQIGAPGNTDHNSAYNLFEDMSIPQEYYTSYKTLKDRKNLIGYVRGNFLSNSDGESIDFSGPNKSLNSRLNFLSINPYNSSGSPNPYKGMYHNLLLYTSCYPIMKNNNGESMCSKHSVGVNIRVHGLSLIECISQYSSADQFRNLLSGTNETKLNVIANFDNAKKYNLKNYNKYYYNQWREVYYYDFIKNSICGNSISPNFIQSYCYFQTFNPNIKFPDNKNKRIITDNQTYSDNIVCALSILTESPDYSVYGWGSNAQKNERGIVSMTHSGYKLPILWVNILQQMLISFYVMYKYKFTFREMALDNNFFIKMLDRTTINGSVWKYNICGINFYLKNYGNLLLVDSGFKDVLDANNIDKPKILMNTLKFNSKENNLNEIYSLLFKNIKNIFDINTFKSGNKTDDPLNKFIGVTSGNGDTLWEEKITNITNIINGMSDKLENIDENTNTSDIEADFQKLFDNLIIETLKDTVHNRVGTLLRDTEVQYVNTDYIKQPKKGDIIVYETGFDSYMFILFISSIDEKNYKCITKENDNFIIKDIPKDLTYSYRDEKNLKLDLKEGEPVSNNDDVIDDSFFIY